MRSPLEIWLRDHREMLRHADDLVELLAPDNVQFELVKPGVNQLRTETARHLRAFATFAEGHFRDEEKLLVPLIKKFIDPSTPHLDEAVGCLTREHAQMHMFMDRIATILPALESEEDLPAADAAELLRISYGIQSIIRHHTMKEEIQIYPLIHKLPLKAVSELFDALEKPSDINLDHLVKPLGPDARGKIADNAEGPEN